MSRASDLANLIASGSTTIFGEAGVTSSDSTGKTTNLQQGLVKVWGNLDGDASTPAVRDSFNVDSVTDVAAGRYRFNYSNNFNAVKQQAGAGIARRNGFVAGDIVSLDSTGNELETSNTGFSVANNGGGHSTEEGISTLMLVGDLA